VYAYRHAFAWLKSKRTTCRLGSTVGLFVSFLFCRYCRHHHHGLSELQSTRFTLIVLTSNVVGLSDLVNMNHIQLDYTIVPTPTPRLLENRLSKKKREREKEIKRKRNRDIHILYFEINCTFASIMTLLLTRNPYAL
jgi:hypothetical protein